jgi:hypothetical protein
MDGSGRAGANTLGSMASLVSTYWNRGRRKVAEGLFMQVIEMSKKVLGERHPNTLSMVAKRAKRADSDNHSVTGFAVSWILGP